VFVGTWNNGPVIRALIAAVIGTVIAGGVGALGALLFRWVRRRVTSTVQNAPRTPTGADDPTVDPTIVRRR
jgi:hypothetical protein